jgi:hypothetical protein
MTNDEGRRNEETRSAGIVDLFVIRASTLIRHSSFVLRHCFADSVAQSVSIGMTAHAD